MSFAFFQSELECVATFWRIYRRDGVTLGFTSHDRDLRFDGVNHLAAPGMVPSAIRLTSSLSGDSAEVSGALTHDSIAELDLSIGRFDGAGISIGAISWETLDRAVLYRGTLGNVDQQAGAFSANIMSSKAVLEQDHIPRTSPTCRARFCGPACGLSAARFTQETIVSEVLSGESKIFCNVPNPADFVHGQCRWLDGPRAGLTDQIIALDDDALVLEDLLNDDIPTGVRVRLIQGCDRTLSTCAGRFGNSLNFQGEPFLPGNDLLARYPAPQ